MPHEVGQWTRVACEPLVCWLQVSGTNCYRAPFAPERSGPVSLPVSLTMDFVVFVRTASLGAVHVFRLAFFLTALRFAAVLPPTTTLLAVTLWLPLLRGDFSPRAVREEALAFPATSTA